MAEFGPRALLVGALLIVIGVVQSVRTLLFLRRGATTEGVVVRVESNNDGDTPIVRFRDPQGRTFEFRVTTVQSMEPWAVGRTHRVRFDRDDPARAEIDAPMHHWSMSALLFGGGCLLIVVGLVLRFVPHPPPQ